ncbi:hypothetical protein [Streptomyces zhihengii]|uniref:Uncharacterized protein n=1 Tax=Streptomyces zhihengii TaxID=1818004 RepID=A0ABS2V2J6_9ACTN|nr:hypothetical protein [Streptomyces zhihengii]MBM9623679.1 hypothetical protein [Streptomyces zhihengii]
MSEDKDSAPRQGMSCTRALGVTVAVLVGLPLLIVLGVVVTFAVQRSVPEDYPTVAPRTTADRAAARSREAYALLGPGPLIPAGESNSFSSDMCYPGGLESAADEPTPGSYALSHTWDVGGVPREDAVAGLERLHDALVADGWRIVAHDAAPGDAELVLRAEHDDEGRQVYFWTPDGGRLRGGVHAACAFDPSGEESWDVTAGLVPPALGRG